MGNFSRDTFDPSKGYVGVRLQQGVPLVDADWNELNDVIRYDCYQGLQALTSPIHPFSPPNYYEPGRLLGHMSSGFVSGGTDNNLVIWPIRGIVAGRPVELPANTSVWIFYFISYDLQPWRDAIQAANDGVEQIPGLTTPTSEDTDASSIRTDIVYLDVWDREIDSEEDTNIVDPVIGIETSVRLKREVCIRVAEGQQTPPSPPSGHHYMSLALLHREEGVANINEDMVEDKRQVAIDMPGWHQLSIPPYFHNYSSASPWRHWYNYTHKPTSETVYGVLPLVLPALSRLRSIRVRARTQVSIEVEVVRTEIGDDITSTSSTVLAEETFTSSSGWLNIDRTFYIDESDSLIRNELFKYFLRCRSWGTGMSRVYHIFVEYEC